MSWSLILSFLIFVIVVSLIIALINAFAIYWYLSKTISFLKCPLVPTFLLLIKARRCDQKNGNVFSQGPIRLGVFCLSAF